MHGAPIFLLSSLLLVPAGFCQTNSADPQVTQALLNEIRQLRLELQSTAATIQRVQIVMYRLQTQSDLLNRATGRAEMVREQCSQAHQQQKFLTEQIEQVQAQLPNAPNSQMRSAQEQALTNLKSNLEMAATEDRECQGRVTEADLQLRAEQAKMTELQDQLDKLDKILASSGK